MKHAYVSVVIPDARNLTGTNIEAIDDALIKTARAFEIVLVVPFRSTDLQIRELNLHGPLTCVQVHPRASRDDSAIAGLSRAAGDFVIEWRGVPEHLDELALSALLEPTNRGKEFIEAPLNGPSASSRFFYRLANSFRPKDMPVRKCVARTYSRHALGYVLNAVTYEPQLGILTAELPVERALVRVRSAAKTYPDRRRRLSEGLMLLSKGTQFGTAVPLTLAAISVSLGLGIAIYAVAIFAIRGTTPEGWTTLMIVTGLGQASVLGMLGLTWSRLDSLSRGLSGSYDTTASVDVIPPGRRDPKGWEASDEGRHI